MAQLQLSLFEFVPEDDFNESEKAVAWYLDSQKKLLFWYRYRVGIVAGLDTTTLFRDGGLIGFTRISSSRPA